MKRRKGALLWLSANMGMLLGLLFLLWLRETSFSYWFFCPLHLLGLYCPGCGMTRAAGSLLRGELLLSLTQHPLLLPAAAVIAFYDAAWALRVCGKRKGSVSSLPAVLLFASLALFFLVRNFLLLALEIDPLGDFLGA